MLFIHSSRDHNSFSPHINGIQCQKWPRAIKFSFGSDVGAKNVRQPQMGLHARRIFYRFFLSGSRFFFFNKFDIWQRFCFHRQSRGTRRHIWTSNATAKSRGRHFFLYLSIFCSLLLLFLFNSETFMFYNQPHYGDVERQLWTSKTQCRWWIFIRIMNIISE